MKKKMMFILPLALAAALLPLSAAPIGQGQFRGAVLQKILDLRSDLDLTKTQQKEIRTIVEGYQSEIKDQWSTGKAAREEMRSAVAAHGPESPQANAAAEKIGDAATSGSLLIAKIVTDVKPLLTEDQLEKVQSGRADIIGMIESRMNSRGL